MKWLIDAKKLLKEIASVKWESRKDYELMKGIITTSHNEALDKNSWIPCSQRMPEEREWIGTEQFGTTISDEVYVTFESPNGTRFVKHLCFQNGKLNNHDQLTIDTFHKGAVPIAWMPLPEAWEK